ncbi:MAG: IS5 family transposase [Anaerolineales bacterium]|nr:IS5 family transposase [Anaerolineales bacterium]
MSTIPTSLTENQFDQHIRPYISTAKRGYECQIPLYKVFNYILYRLHTGCQWHRLPIEPDADDPRQKEISHHAVYYHFRKWSRDGSLEKVWQGSVMTIKADLNLSELNLDGSHAIAKKGGESVAYQGRKKAKTTNILPITDGHGFIIASTGLIAGNHNDAYNLKPHLQAAFKFMKRLELAIQGAFFNADKAFDTKDARKTCFNHGLVPNIDENKRNRKNTKRGRKRFFDPDVYKRRFTSERSFAWIDKFRALLIRYDRRDAYFLGAHFIAFAMINLRHVIHS